MKSPQHLRTDKHRHAHCCHFRIECECVWLSIDIMSKGRPHNDADDLLLCCESVSILMGKVSLLQIQMRETRKLIKSQNEEFTKLRKRLRDSEDDDGLELLGFNGISPSWGGQRGKAANIVVKAEAANIVVKAARAGRHHPPADPHHHHDTATTPPHHRTTPPPTTRHPPSTTHHRQAIAEIFGRW